MRIQARIETDIDEDALVERARGRDREAVAAITRRYNRRLFRVARSILKDDDDAEDALQSGYLKAFTGLSDFRGDSRLGTWLTRIVINEALGLKRKRKTNAAFNERHGYPSGERVIPFPLGADVDPERSVAQRQIQSVLESAIDELPEGYRTVLVARVLEEMSVEETAEAMGIRPETVKTRLHRARHLLRQAIERRVGPLLMDAFPFAGWRCERMTAIVIERLDLLP